jgi:N utilization substance protein B
LLQVLSNPTFSKKVKESKVEQFISDEWVRKIHLQLAQTQEYKKYIASDNRTPAEEKQILQFIWEKLVWGNEEMQEYFAEELPGWEDDKEMTGMLMENFFKNSAKINFLVPLAEEKNKYAHELLDTVIDKEDYCMDLIKPKLAHWDTERIAMVDLLLLRMGVAEMLWFPTIPTKVTINEFIEIAKLYSTPQSGNFVNGVLDNILKDLEKENKIKKQDRIRK